MIKPNEAVAIGASMATLSAACAPCETLQRVVLVEHDHLPAGAFDQRGVPQAGRLLKHTPRKRLEALPVADERLHRSPS